MPVSLGSPVPPAPPLVCFGGSRALAPSYAPLVSAVVSAALARGFSVSVGCAAGADQLVLSAVLAAGAAPSCAVYAVGESSGRGFWRGSAPIELLRSAVAAGVRLVWSAGGSAAIPFRARLLRRSLASLVGARCAVFFLAVPGSPGSLRVAAAAAGSGCQVFAFACGFSGAPAALAGCAGSWVPASLAGRACWLWRPQAEQLSLF